METVLKLGQYHNVKSECTATDRTAVTTLYRFEYVSEIRGVGNYSLGLVRKGSNKGYTYNLQKLLTLVIHRRLLYESKLIAEQPYQFISINNAQRD